MDIEKFSVPFLESSSSNKIPIIFLHGFGGDKDNWIRMIPHLKDQYRAISLDLPGFGESNRLPDENYSIAEQVKRLKKFTEKLGLKKFHIVGNSMGGSISAYYASQYPDEIISLILIDSAGVTSPIKSDLEIEIEKGYNPLLVKNMDDFDKLNNFIFVKKPYILGSNKEYFVEKALENTNINVKNLNDIRNEKNPVEASLSKIKSHTLILWGDTEKQKNFNSLERDAYDLSLKRYRDLKGVIDTSFHEGEQIGLEKGKKIGLEEGEQIGLEKGQQIGLRKIEDLAIKNALQKGKLSVEEIAEMLEIPLDRVIQIKNEI